jgi:hypothetical protein
MNDIIDKDNKVILDVALNRIETDVDWAASGYAANEGRDIVESFGYDHGNMLIRSKAGKLDLLFTHNGDSLRSNACRILYRMTPKVIRELIRGYKLARACGLLGDGKVCSAVLDHLSKQVPDPHSLLIGIADVLRCENRKPGGIKSS